MKIEVNTCSNIFKKFCTLSTNDILQNKLIFITSLNSNKKLIFGIFKDMFNIEPIKINTCRVGHKDSCAKKVIITFKTPNDSRNFTNTLKHYISANKE